MPGRNTSGSQQSYNDPYFGGVQCNENQHPQFTNVTCKFVSSPDPRNPSVIMTSNQANLKAGDIGQFRWVNDFGGNSIIGTRDGQPIPSTSGTLTYTATGPVLGRPATGYTGQVVYTS